MLADFSREAFSSPVRRMTEPFKIAVVIPSFRVRDHILGVIAGIGPEVWRIYVVDDCCPEGSGNLVEERCREDRVRVVRNAQNLGVGGAVMAGYRAAMDDGAEVIVKIDGDGQMDASLLPRFVAPILAGEADYTKGNRFFDLAGVLVMPRLRMVGNAALSLVAKLSTGYWDLFDPTNGYTAIHAEVARQLPFDRISQGYFFETDMLFRLNIQRAVVVDVPMDAHYANEVSNLKISSIVGEFFFKHVRNCAKRIFYNYYLRDLSVASLELPLGLVLMGLGSAFGIYSWMHNAKMGATASAGTVMLSALPILMGLQLLLAFLSYDISSVPRRPRHMAKAARWIAARREPCPPDETPGRQLRGQEAASRRDGAA